MGLPFIKEAVTQLFSKPSTEKYPFVPKYAPEGYRGRIVFHPELCIQCTMCEKVCAGGAITDEIVELPDGGKQITKSFFLGSCTFCRTCADFCTRHAIELTTDYHMVARDENELVVKGTFVKKPIVKPNIPPKAPKAPVAAEAPKAPEAAKPEEGCQAE